MLLLFEMQRDRNIPDLESMIDAPMWLELTFGMSLLRMIFCEFSYNSIAISLVFIYLELFCIKYSLDLENGFTYLVRCYKKMILMKL